jgi:apolipoprotein D and lipocalin family protein
MRKLGMVALALGASAILAACAKIPRPGPVGNRAVPEPAKPVSADRYMGRWYEQFRYEASFQKGMDGVFADYSLNPDGSVKVVNSGREGGPGGTLKVSRGKARIVDPDTGAKLKVSFFGPFYGDYWVLDHGDDYEWSIVGEPSGRYLWVLTREQRPDAVMLASLEARVKQLGYHWSLIRRTRQ